MITHEHKPEIEFTGVLIPDAEGKGFTAYFAEFPEIIAQGANKEDAKINLIDALQSMIDFRKEQNEEVEEFDHGVITESYKFALA